MKAEKLSARSNVWIDLVSLEIGVETQFIEIAALKAENAALEDAANKAMAVVDMAPRVDMIIVEKVEIEPIIITTTNGNPIVETKAKPVWTRSMKRVCGGYARPDPNLGYGRPTFYRSADAAARRPLQAFYSERSEGQLMKRMEFDLLFRWFVGLGADEPVWGRFHLLEEPRPPARRRRGGAIPGNAAGRGLG